MPDLLIYDLLLILMHKAENEVCQNHVVEPFSMMHVVARDISVYHYSERAALADNR